MKVLNLLPSDCSTVVTVGGADVAEDALPPVAEVLADESEDDIVPCVLCCVLTWPMGRVEEVRRFETVCGTEQRTPGTRVVRS